MRALIYGITGQDGSYLAESLLEKGYEVHGVSRWCSSNNTVRIDGILDRINLHIGSVTDLAFMYRLTSTIKPHQIFNLAALSSTRELTHHDVLCVVGTGAVNVYRSVLDTGINTSIFQASSSEMFSLETPPQDESTRPWPTNPYGAAKLLAHNMARYYRESHGLAISCGVLFNHESPRRTEAFVSRKITMSAVRNKLGSKEKLKLWDIGIKRDWGYAKEYVEAMWLTLQDLKGGDYCIGTGISHTVKDFVERAYNRVGLDWRDHVEYQSDSTTNSEPRANNAKIARRLRWEPKTTFNDLVDLMVDHDLKLLS